MVRQSELEAARRGALTKLKNTGRVQAQILARFHHLDPSNDRFGVISVDGGPQMRVPVAPGKYVPDTIVIVLIDAAGKPVQVLAPRTDRPEGADEGLVFGAETAWKAIAPRELTPEEAAAIQDTADGLAEAQSDLADMSEYAGEEFSRLDTALDGLAAGVNGVTYSTEEPSEPGRNEGDTWFQMDGDGTAGFWRWNGTEWQPTEFEDTVLGDVTLGKLRAGSAVVDEAVLGKLWADGISARTALFSRATIAARNMIPGIETLATYGDISAEERATLPLREFGINANDPSVWLQGEKTGWVWAQIPVTEGERYRFSVDVRASVSQTVFYMQTKVAGPGGSDTLTAFDAWTDWTRSPITTGASGSYPFQNVIHGQATWRSYWSEATATASGVISLMVYANHSNGAVNDSGYQWFRNLRMEAMQDGSLWVDGVVNARHLNIVPEDGVGGLEALPPGIRIIPPDGEAGNAISMRIDEPNWIAFAQAGRNTFSVSPDGKLGAQKIEARESLRYMGVELQELLDRQPRGNLGWSRLIGDTPWAGTTQARILMCQITTPADNRLIRIEINIQTNRQNSGPGTIYLRQSTGTSVKETNTAIQEWPVYVQGPESFTLSKIGTVDSFGWPRNERITLGVFVAYGVEGGTYPFLTSRDQHMSIDDIGPATSRQQYEAHVPTSGGGSGGGAPEEDPGKRDDDDKFYPVSTRSYRGNGSHYNWNEAMLFHGYSLSANGQLRSLAVFNRSQVNTLVSGDGTEMVSGYLKLFNAHTWSSQGMTVRVGYSNHTSVPSTWNGVSGDWTWIGNFEVDRGGVLTVPLTSTHLDRIKSGAFNAVGLVSNSNAGTQYGYFDAAKTELFVKVRK